MLCALELDIDTPPVFSESARRILGWIVGNTKMCRPRRSIVAFQEFLHGLYEFARNFGFLSLAKGWGLQFLISHGLEFRGIA